MSLKHGENTKKLIDLLEKESGKKHPNANNIVKTATELSAWAADMESESYHDLYVHSFIGMWSSFESGVENIVSDFLEHDVSIAASVAARFKSSKVNADEVPWDKEKCMEIAQKLEAKAKKETTNGGIDIFARYKTLFGWLEIEFHITEENAIALAEANQVRNILLHRFGEVSAKDAMNFPVLAQWKGRVMPLNQHTFDRYYRSMSSFLVSLMKGISERMKSHKSDTT